MKEYIFVTLIYLFGFVGLISIGVIPLRSWSVLRSVLDHRIKLLSALATLSTMAAVSMDAQITLRIFRCLTQRFCGPGVGSGWIYLAILGITYLAFEIATFLIVSATRTRAGAR